MPLTSPELVILFKVDHLHGVHKIVVQVGYQDASGWWQTPAFGLSQPASAYADLQITAYIDIDTARTWGCSHAFTPIQIELAQAESIVKVLRKIHRGLDRADAEHGYLPLDDFHRYVIRIATILGITDYRVPATPGERAATGETVRQVTGAGLQRWIDGQVHTIAPAR